MLTNTKKQIINTLLTGKKSLTELASTIKSSKPSILWQLAELEQRGIVEKRIEKTLIGREAIYELKSYTTFLSLSSYGGIQIETSTEFEPEFLLLEQVKNGEFKSDLRILLKKLSKKLSKSNFIILFGSVAQEHGTWKSDIDIAIISPENEQWKNKIEELIAEASQKTKHQIKPKFISFDKFMVGASLFVKEVKDTGMIIWGHLLKGEVWKEMKRYKNI